MNESKGVGGVLIGCAEVFEGISLDRRDADAALGKIRSIARGDERLRETAKLLEGMIKQYFMGLRKNAREEKRFLKQSRRRLKRKQRGKSAVYAIRRAEIMDVRKARRDISIFLRDAARRF